MLDGDEGHPPMVWCLPPPLYLDQRIFRWMKIQAFAGCVLCCTLVYACFVDELFCCFPQHLALFILSLFALTGFINLKLDVMPYVKNKNGYTRVLIDGVKYGEKAISFSYKFYF
jgi:hypothetical protein